MQTFATLGAVGSWMIYYICILNLFAITVNRFTALMWPLMYKKVHPSTPRYTFTHCVVAAQIWTRRVVSATIAACWLAPSPYGIVMALPEGRSCYSDDDETWSEQLQTASVDNALWLVDFIIEVIVLWPSFLVMYLIMLVRVGLLDVGAACSLSLRQSCRRCSGRGARTPTAGSMRRGA